MADARALRGLRVLAVVPHPDDETYAMAGALALAVRDGASVPVVCATRGEQGEVFSPQPPPSPGAVAVLRARELAASCRIIGAAAPRFLDLPDGGLPEVAGEVLAGRVLEVLREIEPQAVIALGADGAYGHRDHLALTEALRDAVAARAREAPPGPRLVLAAFPRGLFLPQWRRMSGGPNADKVGDEPPALGVEPWAVACRLDVRAVRRVKRAAMAAHRSQLPDGTPESLFPPGIVEALLAEEWFQVEGGPTLPGAARSPFDGLAPGI